MKSEDINKKKKRKKMDVKTKNSIYILLVLTFTIVVFTRYGRNVPYDGHNETKSGNDIQALAIISDLSGSIGLGSIAQTDNLIPGAYANRTMLVLKYNNAADKLKEEITSNLYKDGALVSSDNLIYKNDNDVYEIFIMDHKFTEEDVQKFTVGNKQLFGENEEGVLQQPIKIAFDQTTKEGLVSKNLSFSVDGNKFIRVANIADDEMIIIPFNKEENFISNRKFEAVNMNNNEPVSDYQFVALSLNNKDWPENSLKPVKIKANSTGSDLKVKQIGLKPEGSNIIIPFDQSIKDKK